MTVGRRFDAACKPTADATITTPVVAVEHATPVAVADVGSLIPAADESTAVVDVTKDISEPCDPVLVEVPQSPLDDAAAVVMVTAPGDPHALATINVGTPVIGSVTGRTLPDDAEQFFSSDSIAGAAFCS
jgi:hypothetical protein